MAATIPTPAGRLYKLGRMIEFEMFEISPAGVPLAQDVWLDYCDHAHTNCLPTSRCNLNAMLEVWVGFNQRSIANHNPHLTRS